MKIKKSETELLKSYIIEAFIILLNQKCFPDITVKEITFKAGVNRSTYYRNFDSKEDIIKLFYKSLLDKCVSKESSQNLENHLLNIFNQFLLYKDELLCLHKNHLSYHLLNILNEYFSEYVYNNKKNLENNFDIFYHTGGIFNTFLLWFDCEMKPSPTILVQKSIKILPPDFKPILNEK